MAPWSPATLSYFIIRFCRPPMYQLFCNFQSLGFLGGGRTVAEADAQKGRFAGRCIAHGEKRRPSRQKSLFQQQKAAQRDTVNSGPFDNACEVGRNGRIEIGSHQPKPPGRYFACDRRGRPVKKTEVPYGSNTSTDHRHKGGSVPGRGTAWHHPISGLASQAIGNVGLILPTSHGAKTVACGEKPSAGASEWHPRR